MSEKRPNETIQEYARRIKDEVCTQATEDTRGAVIALCDMIELLANQNDFLEKNVKVIADKYRELDRKIYNI